MIDYFIKNKLSLNLSKSAFLVINDKFNDKSNIYLKNGILEYKSVVTYLGAKISDTGCIKHDIDLYIEEKRCNVTIKFCNFCQKNYLAPVETKLQVLKTCASASLIYGCETWGYNSLPKIETIYRQGIKTALSVRNCVNNEIVYVESGEFPLIVRISKQQLKFWLNIKELSRKNKEHYISKIINNAQNYPFIRYYEQLEERFQNPKNCEIMLKNDVMNDWKQRIILAAENDIDSKVGTYWTVNAALKTPLYENKLEYERIIITRYRTGSHNLLIEKEMRFKTQTHSSNAINLTKQYLETIRSSMKSKT